MTVYPQGLPARARRARAQLLALRDRRPLAADHEPEALLRVVEAAALHRAAGLVLRALHVPPGLSVEAAASWRAARSAAVLALVDEADRTTPPPPSASCPPPAAPGRDGPPPGLGWSQDPASTG
ncbi:hypothetical protein ACIRQY_34660 [Streptomyces sp. NPDC101490]|uniref:hypothetical protein n=1 Tax=Streptomyces sp. NPDC101490 TaxID=3366143 RepID=UPI00380C510A